MINMIGTGARNNPEYLTLSPAALLLIEKLGPQEPVRKVWYARCYWKTVI